MKYLKYYELINQDKPKIGDYVICRQGKSHLSEEHERVQKLLTTIIGQIVDDQGRYNNVAIAFEEDDIPPELNDFFSHRYKENLTKYKYLRWMRENEVEYWSENKEDLISVLTAKNYNL